MAKNKVQVGSVLTLTHNAAVTSGWLFRKGAIIGVVLQDAPANTPFTLDTEGVWDIDKVAGDNLAAGDTAYADGANDITATAAGNTAVGYVTEAAGAGTTSVKVRLIPKAVV